MLDSKTQITIFFFLNYDQIPSLKEAVPWSGADIFGTDLENAKCWSFVFLVYVIRRCSQLSVEGFGPMGLYGSLRQFSFELFKILARLRTTQCMWVLRSTYAIFT